MFLHLNDAVFQVKLTRALRTRDYLNFRILFIRAERHQRIKEHSFSVNFKTSSLHFVWIGLTMELLMNFHAVSGLGPSFTFHTQRDFRTGKKICHCNVLSYKVVICDHRKSVVTERVKAIVPILNVLEEINVVHLHV